MTEYRLSVRAIDDDTTRCSLYTRPDGETSHNAWQKDRTFATNTQLLRDEADGQLDIGDQFIPQLKDDSIKAIEYDPELSKEIKHHQAERIKAFAEQVSAR